LPVATARNIKRDNQRVVGEGDGRPVLRVLAPQRRDGTVVFGSAGEQPDRAFEEDEPEPAPVLFIVVDEDGRARVGPEVADPA
jgi:hypothetical protein